MYSDHGDISGYSYTESPARHTYFPLELACVFYTSQVLLNENGYKAYQKILQIFKEYI